MPQIYSPRYTQVRRMVAPIEPLYLVLVRTANGQEFISNPMDADKANAAIDRLVFSKGHALTIGDKLFWCEADKLVWIEYTPEQAYEESKTRV